MGHLSRTEVVKLVQRRAGQRQRHRVGLPRAEVRALVYANLLGYAERPQVLATAWRMAQKWSGTPADSGQAPAPEEVRREAECEERWPECWPGGYDPRCCRWPKSCSVELGGRGESAASRSPGSV